LNRRLKSIIANSWLELAARWILGLIFIYASFHKIVAPSEFAKILYGYDLFPAVLINLIAIITPFLELVTGMALILGFYPRSAALIINALLLVFIAVLSINLIRGHEFDCGCFSAAKANSKTSAGFSLIQDFLFLALGLQVYFYSGTRPRRLVLKE
jgi:uncharacterized membrane protein YphA (DoxX/SURF4 family)